MDHGLFAVMAVSISGAQTCCYYSVDFTL